MPVLEIILWLLFFSAANLIVLGLFGIRFYRTVPAAIPLAIFMFVTAALAILLALDLTSPSLEAKILYNNTRFLFVPYLSFLSLWIILIYTGTTRLIRRDLAAIALVIPVSTTLLAITSPFHTFFRYNFSLDFSGIVPVLRYTDSPFILLYTLYNLFITAFALGILVYESNKQQKLADLRTVLLFAAVIIPTVTNYLFVAGITPLSGVNLSALVFWIPGVLFTIVIFRYGFFDIVPVARRRMFEILSSPMIVLDRAGRIIDINPAARALFPKRKGTLKGDAVSDVAGDWPEFLELCMTRTDQVREITRVRDMVTQHYRGSVDLLRNPDGEITASLILLQDISERKQAEDELFLAYEQIAATEEELRGQYEELCQNEHRIRESEEKYRAVVTQANDGIIIIKDGKIRFANPRSVEIFGGQGEKLVNIPFADTIHPRERDRVLELYRKRMEGAEVPRVYETTVIRENHETVEVELNAGIITYEGKPADLIYVRDITERKRAQKALEQAKKKLNLLNYVTFNDLRSHLFSLLGYLNLATMMTTDLENPVRQILERETALVQKIADSLKFAQTYQDLGLRPAKWQNVNHMFLFAISHLDFRTVQHSVTTGTLEVYSDPLAEQVFQILADNTLAHGKTATAVTVGYSIMPDESLIISYEDNGIGIPDTQKEKIFLAEFQTKKSVGLFLAREILDITGIAIRETGTYGNGTRFEILVPKGAYRFA